LNDNTAIQLTTKEVLMQLIKEEQQKYPFSLKVPDLMQLLNASDTAVYEKLERGEIPGAKKYKGIGWRVPRDLVLAWLYGQELEKDLTKEVRV